MACYRLYIHAMNKQYLLLRSNNQSGPFTLPDLLQFNLTPKDLLWVEGHSAGWCYPFELDELKEVVSTSVLADVSPVYTNNQAKEQTENAALKKQSPQKIFVSLPHGLTTQKIAEETPSLEDRAEALRQKAVNFTPQTEALNEEGAEVKYTRSLDDIKTEYSGWMKEKKKKKRKSVIGSPLFYTALFCVMAVVSFLFIQWKPKKTILVQQEQATNAEQVKTDVALVNHQEKYAKASVSKTSILSTGVSLPDSKQDVKVFKPIPINTDVKVFKPDAINMDEKVFKPVTINREQEAAPIKTAETPASTILVAAKETIRPIEKDKEIPITDLLQTSSQYIKTREGLGLAISIENKSEQLLRMAAIDVLYFDKSKKEIARQTVYFSTILPHTKVTKNSSYQKAVSASYHIGLVSSEKAGLYVMQ